jgi:hypothetical protein
MFYGPNIITDGLVLALDAANIKSFRGEPTVNLVPSPTNMESGWNNATSNGTVTRQTLSDNTALVTYTRDSNSSGFAQRNCILGVNGDNQTPYTITVTYEVLEAINAPNFEMAVRLNASPFTRYVILPMITTPGRYTITATGVPPTTTTSLGVITNLTKASSSITINFIEIQVEQKPYSTPFVNGTRGATVETGGGWADRSGNSINGELVNNPTFDIANRGSLVFDGVDDYINIGNSIWSTIFDNTINNNFTLSLWMKPTNIGTDQALISQRHGDAMSLFLMSNGKVTFEMDDTQNFVGTNSILENNIWYNIIVTFYNNTSNSYCEYYVNGDFERSETKWDGNGTTINNNLWIGWQSRTNYGRNPGFFEGLISYIHIYNRAISSHEVKQNYNAIKGRYN